MTLGLRSLAGSLMLVLCVPSPSAWSAELLVGGATISITPDRPVALEGQRHLRISQAVESPVTATALALETRDGDKVLDQVIFVSCDLVAIRNEISPLVRQHLKDRLPGFDLDKLILTATHTHTAPVTQEGRYEFPTEGIMQPQAYIEFLVQQLADVIEKAWQARKPGSVGWGLGHAAIAYNRRPIYDDGRAQMYGKVNEPDFRGIEGNEDHGVEVLCFWDAQQKLIATAVNVACPAQEVEGRSTINADYWHETRELLRQKHGKDLLVLGWIGAGGDQSPHVIYRKAAEQRMEKLRGITRLAALAQRIVHAWEEAYDGAKRDMRSDVELVHKLGQIKLTPRIITQEESLEAKRQAAEFKDKPGERWNFDWHQKVVDRYEKQQTGPLKPFVMELHVLRLGDVAIATNPFELFTEFGIQMKARSPAIQTFVIQLACQSGLYLPTAEAMRAGSYSAVPQSNLVGPEGGRELVEQTLELIDSLWPKK